MFSAIYETLEKMASWLCQVVNLSLSNCLKHVWVNGFHYNPVPPCQWMDAVALVEELVAAPPAGRKGSG